LASCSLAGVVTHTAVAWLTVSTVLAACGVIAQYVWLSRQASRRTIRIFGSRVGTAQPSSELNLPGSLANAAADNGFIEL
jgi:hypothetical protein